MLFKSEINKIRVLINRLINSITKKIDHLENHKLNDPTKLQKTITEILDRLVRITIEINKSFAQAQDEHSKKIDQNIIEEFYNKYKNVGFNEFKKKNNKGDFKE